MVAAIIGYVLKTSFTKALDVKIEKLKEENRASINEQVRRQAFLFDQHYELYKKALSVIYRLRNTLRELKLEIDKVAHRKSDPMAILRYIEIIDEYADEHNTLRTHGDKLQDMLYENRALIPESIFAYLHDVKHVIYSVRNALSIIREKDPENRLKDLKKLQYECELRVENHIVRCV